MPDDHADDDDDMRLELNTVTKEVTLYLRLTMIEVDGL